MGEKYVLAEFGFSASIGVWPFSVVTLSLYALLTFCQDNLDVVVGCPLCYVNAGQHLYIALRLHFLIVKLYSVAACCSDLVFTKLFSSQSAVLQIKRLSVPV